MTDKLRTTPPAENVEELITVAVKFKVPSPAHLNPVVDLIKLPEQVRAKFPSFVRCYGWAPPVVDQWYADHAHRLGQEIFVCTDGEVELLLHDGFHEENVILSRGEALFIPLMIWHKVRIKNPGGKLLVLSDVSYDREADYIEKSFEEFVRLAQNAKQ